MVAARFNQDLVERLVSAALQVLEGRGAAAKDLEVRWVPGSFELPLAAINSPGDELGPEPSADGRCLFFYSDRAGGLGGYDLWVSLRAEGAGDPGFNHVSPSLRSRRWPSLSRLVER